MKEAILVEVPLFYSGPHLAYRNQTFTQRPTEAITILCPYLDF